MKHALTIGVVTIAMLFLAVPTSQATSWCSKGPDEQPDHPCDDDSDAVEAAAVKFGAQWQSISGVRSVYGVQNSGSDGDYMELEVIVDPPTLAPSIQAVLPTEAGGFPVKVIAQPPDLSYGNQTSCASKSQSSDDDDASSDRLDEALADDETRSWVKLPGVLAVGAELSECDCDPPKIAVEVQPAMMASVKEQLPASTYGFQVVVEPAQ